MTVKVNINISNRVVKDLFVFFPNSTKEGVTKKDYLCSHIVPPSLICGYAKLLVENVCSVLQSTH